MLQARALHMRHISIHAPVKGATHGWIRPSTQIPISIHAPVKGATQFGVGVTVYLGISIHAPVKGATTVEVP